MLEKTNGEEGAGVPQTANQEPGADIALPGSRMREHLLRVAMEHFARSGEQQITVALLSRNAKVARGTIYNHFGDADELFDLVTRTVVEEAQRDIAMLDQAGATPQLRLAKGLAAILRRAHEDQIWGLFLARFAPSCVMLQSLFNIGYPSLIRESAENGTLPDVPDRANYLQLVAGGVYSFILLIVDGRRSWRDACRDLVFMLFRAGGASHDVAQQLAAEALASLGGGQMPPG